METMIIYKIQNLIDNKIYIGQTLFTFNIRYSGGKWWKNTSCKHLKRAAEKYGYENFSVEILEKNISSAQVLDDLERFYIKKYNCMEPNGYNINSGGESKHFYSREQRIVLAKSKRGAEFIELKNQLTEEVIRVENTSEFCQKHNLSDGHLCDVLKGRILSCGHWTLPHITMRFWILKNEDGREEKVIENDGRKFCAEHGLKERDFEQLVRGLERGGWRVNFFQPRIGWTEKKQKARTHAPTKNLNKFLSGNGARIEKIYLLDMEEKILHSFINEYDISNKVKFKLSLKCGKTMINAFLLKHALVLEDRFILVDENEKPLNPKINSYSGKLKIRKLLSDFITSP